MSNELTTVTTSMELTFKRQGKNKADGTPGKIVERDIIGLMTSGNKTERSGAADGMIQICWDNRQYKPIMRNFARVFAGRDFDAIINILAVDVDKPNRIGMLALLAALVRGTAGKTLKGEKAIYLSYAVDLVARADAADAVREAAKELGVTVPALPQ